MAFKEKTKLIAKKKSDFTCCWCKDRKMVVEVHHIDFQEHGGDDTIKNAAPLCPNCHELIGSNITKKKQLLERRDFWWEQCEHLFEKELLKEEAIKKVMKETFNEFIIDKTPDLNQGEPIATINDEIIYKSEIDFIYSRIPEENRFSYSKRNLVTQLVNEKLLLQESKRNDIKVEAQHKKDFYQQILDTNGIDEESLIERLNEQSLTIEDLEKEIEKQVELSLLLSNLDIAEGDSFNTYIKFLKNKSTIIYHSDGILQLLKEDESVNAPEGYLLLEGDTLNIGGSSIFAKGFYTDGVLFGINDFVIFVTPEEDIGIGDLNLIINELSEYYVLFEVKEKMKKKRVYNKLRKSKKRS